MARRFQVVMLSDEIYGEIHHEGGHVSIAEFYPEGTIISTGLSKWCGAGGWRLGTFTFPHESELAARCHSRGGQRNLHRNECTHPSSQPLRPSRGGAFIREYLIHCRRVLRALGRHCAAMLRSAELDVAAPVGAFYLFPDFRRYQPQLRAKGISTSRELSDRLLQDTGVATLPGYSFGRQTFRADASHGVRRLRRISGVEGRRHV